VFFDDFPCDRILCLPEPLEYSSVLRDLTDELLFIPDDRRSNAIAELLTPRKPMTSSKRAPTLQEVSPKPVLP